MLDSLREEARRLNGALGADDRHKLDEYLTGIRDLERRMQDESDWLRQPKPNVAALDFGKDQGLDPDKAGLDYRRYQRLMFDVITLALQTDSTRVISYLARMDGSDGTGAWRSLGNPYNYHEMTHHGEDPDKLKWFTRADTWYMEEWAYFLEQAQSRSRKATARCSTTPSSPTAAAAAPSTPTTTITCRPCWPAVRAWASSTRATS